MAFDTKISVLLHTSSFRNDHSADVCEAHDLKEGETVEELVNRLLGEKETKWGPSWKEDHIELRRIIPLDHEIHDY